MEKLRIGLLPLYVKLYDDNWPELRERVDAFHHTIAAELEKRGLEVIHSPVCRIKPEFEEAVRSFEEQEVDAAVTLHLAYSPSLESAGVLSATSLPLVVLDTTPAFEFGPGQHPDEMLYNHGIHGVQDLCSLLVRSGKPFRIEAGHWAESDVLDRVADAVKAARLAKRMKNARVGRIGKPFEGMGDFAVPEEVLRATIGVSTVEWNLQAGGGALEAVSEEQIDEEMKQDKMNFRWGRFEEGVYRQSVRDGLAVRSWVTRNKLTAFTVNFMEVTRQSAITTMPFLEASKAMSRGVGYAGEGDVLTAALTGAILSVYPDASFAEMFCPDWRGNSIFLSHMGEMNVRIAAKAPVLEEKDFPFTDADNPIAAYGGFRGGEAVYVSLSPGPDHTYTLILAPGEMLEAEAGHKLEGLIHGWFRPGMPVSDFLAAYSRLGGIHHGVVVYGDVVLVLEQFGGIMGWNTVRIG